jgi:glucose/arabinose dehydrogenase
MDFHPRFTWLITVGVILLSAACGPLRSEGSTPPPQIASTATLVDSGTATSMPLCTPPACQPGESYYCPGECPGGCGTVCMPDTPTPSSGSEPGATTEPQSAQVFPDPSRYTWFLVAEGLVNPLSLTHAGDGSGRLLILEQPGLVRVVQGGQLLSTPFLDIRDRVLDRNNEQGLLGLAFHPDYENNGTLYVNYTGKGGDTYISRFSVTSDPNLADPDSEKVLMRIPQPYANHNGGHLLFGPDGYLYIGTGDGGSGGDPQGNAQNLNSLLGKMLRIDVDHGDPYGIPADNPFVGGGGLPEIWAYGLRNPWRYAFDRATGDLYIGDVGQNTWEEIDVLAAPLPAGSNFGWNYWEGAHAFQGTPPQDAVMIPPVWEYDHTQGCSITGGVPYRGAYPDWSGIYFYADFCSGTIWGLLQDGSGTWRNQVLFQTGTNITSFGEDEAGELYRVDRAGSVYRLEILP